jgi:streptothricin acetyltransferase
MNHILRIAPGQAQEWSQSESSFMVESELRLCLSDGRLTYDVVAVVPYEKTYGQEGGKYFRAADTDVFIAYFENQPAGELRLSKSWNGYAYIDNIVVSKAFRRQGVGTALVRQAIEWSQSKSLPGVMIETQSNNVAACLLYDHCGFQLTGFDSNLYRGLEPRCREVALFRYWHANAWATDDA